MHGAIIALDGSDRLTCSSRGYKNNRSDDTCLFSFVVRGVKTGSTKELDLPFSNFPEETTGIGTLSTICFRSKSWSRPYNICLTFSNALSKLSSCAKNYNTHT
jgi:hypothetical protein